MKLVVGLGNPGRKYADTRHNIGFHVVAELQRRYGQSKPRARFHGELVEAMIDQQRAWLLAPLTYMNRSGKSVLAARDFYKLPDEDILIICDDFSLPLAKLRFRAQGSAGGQKGLEDIIRCLGTQQIARLRIGIGPLAEGREAADFVLSKFAPDDRVAVEQAISRAAEAAACWIRQGIQYCMNQYN